MESIFHELHRSGLTKKEFASRIEVALPRFEYWLRLAECRDEFRQCQERVASSTDGCREVQRGCAAGTSFELEFPGGVLLRLPSETTPDCLRRVVEVLSDMDRTERKETDR